MIISFRGRGWVVGIITVVCLLLSDLLTSIRFRDSNYYGRNGWPKLVAFWVAAGIVRWMLPRAEEDVPLGRQEVSGQNPVLRERVSFLLLPVKYWPLVLLALGVGFYFVRG
jgi:H+/Cl- antiporter ClcA